VGQQPPHAGPFHASQRKACRPGNVAFLPVQQRRDPAMLNIVLPCKNIRGAAAPAHGDEARLFFPSPVTRMKVPVCPRRGATRKKYTTAGVRQCLPPRHSFFLSRHAAAYRDLLQRSPLQPHRQARAWR